MTLPPESRARSAFSLVEVLVALALMALVLTLAGLLLGGAGRMVEALRTPPPHTGADFVRGLENDLDHLVRGPLPPDETGLLLHPEEGLSFSVLLADATKSPRRFRLHYRWNPGDGIQRVQYDPVADTAVTNTLLRTYAQLRLEARNLGQSSNLWPPDNETFPPAVLRVEMEVPGESPLLRDLFLPASLRAVPTPTETP